MKKLKNYIKRPKSVITGNELEIIHKFNNFPVFFGCTDLSKENDLVADFYLGSGTTAVVCKELNRNFIGCDINPKAIEITNARLEALS